MYQYFMNNPLGRKTVGDCSVRAISKALGVSWDEAHDMLSDMSKNMGTIMNDNDVISAVAKYATTTTEYATDYADSERWICNG